MLAQEVQILWRKPNPNDIGLEMCYVWKVSMKSIEYMKQIARIAMLTFIIVLIVLTMLLIFDTNIVYWLAQ